MRSPTLQVRFEELRARRHRSVSQLRDLPPPALWARPSDDAWSIGQWLEHLGKTLRLVRWGLRIYLPLARPMARRRRNDEFEREVVDVYVRDPHRVPSPFPGIRARDRSSEPIPLDTVMQRLDRQTRSLETMLASVDEAEAGTIRLWDGPVGWINLLQAAHQLGHHERHDLAVVDRLRQQLDT